MKTTKRLLLWASVIIGAGLWLVYVWPTQWEHYQMGGLNLQVNRFTGKTEWLTQEGWRMHTDQPSGPWMKYKAFENPAN